jgi:arylformamidase
MPKLPTLTPPTQWDAEYLDNQYNNRLRVPDFVTRHVTPWQTRSLRVRTQQACLLDIPYGPSAAEKLDVFPGGGTRQPVLVFIHGGYWRSLDKADHSFVAPAFTPMGACVVVPNYALCKAGGQVTLQDIVMQLVRSLAWVHRTIAQYGGDPHNITVVGHSAGGHLAAMMLACQWQKFSADLPDSLVRKALSISGLHDLEPIRQAPYLQTDLNLSREQALRYSPAHFAPPSGKLYAVCGGDESAEFKRQNTLIQTAWGHRCVPVSETIPGRNHFSMLEALTTPANRVHRLACQLLEV